LERQSPEAIAAKLGCAQRTAEDGCPHMGLQRQGALIIAA